MKIELLNEYLFIILALVAANQAYEGVNTLDFIVNFQSDDLRFDASQIQLACDSTQTWTSSLSSFPGNTIGDVARTNIRRPADGNGFNNRRVSNIRDPWDGTSRPLSRP